MKKAKNIGIKVKAPSKGSPDSKDPFFGNVKVRGNQFVGVVTRAKMRKTATGMGERKKLVPKNEG